MTHPLTHTYLLSLSTAPRLPVLAGLAVRFAYVVTQWEKRRRTRIDLNHLDDALLKDVGLTRYQARREVTKQFWQP